MIRNYISLTKPGIIFGNVLVAASAFVFGAPDAFDWKLFLYMNAGLSLVIAGAAVFNNYVDRFIDAKMERTKHRPLAAGTIPLFPALMFGTALSLAGAGLLWLTNPYAFGAALVGFFGYVLVYTPMKHVSGYAVYVGAVAGATPPVVGYAAATGLIDTTAAWLFVLLFLWQLPHFIAIAMFRFHEYTAAGVPLLISEPSDTRKTQARKIFYASLVVLLVFCGALILHRWIK